MPSKRVPSYLRHKPSGQARVRIDGRDIYLGVYGSDESHQAYAREIAAWQARQDRPPQDITVSQLTVLYVQHAKGYYVKGGKPTDHLVKIRNALKYLTRMYRTLPAADFGPKKLMKLRQSFVEQGHSRTYVNDLIGVVKRAFKWAVSEELVPASVHQGLSTVGILRKGRTEAREPEPVRPVPDALVDAIQSYVRREVWGLIQLQRATGMRPSEARLMRGCDLNMSGDIWEYRPASHKCEHHEKERVVMIGPRGQAVLKDFLRADLTAYLFSSDGEGARPYRIDTYRNAIVRGCEVAFGMPYRLRYIDAYLKQQELTDTERAELRDKLLAEAREWRRENCWSPNRLRHNFGTAARRHAGIEAARVTLGHSSAATSEIYAERDLEAARAVVAKIG